MCSAERRQSSSLSADSVEERNSRTMLQAWKAEQREPWYLQRMPQHLPSSEGFNSQVAQEHQVEIAPAKPISCK